MRGHQQGPSLGSFISQADDEADDEAEAESIVGLRPGSAADPESLQFQTELGIGQVYVLFRRIVGGLPERGC